MVLENKDNVCFVQIVRDEWARLADADEGNQEGSTGRKLKRPTREQAKESWARIEQACRDANLKLPKAGAFRKWIGIHMSFTRKQSMLAQSGPRPRLLTELNDLDRAVMNMLVETDTPHLLTAVLREVEPRWGDLQGGGRVQQRAFKEITSANSRIAQRFRTLKELFEFLQLNMMAADDHRKLRETGQLNRPVSEDELILLRLKGVCTTSAEGTSAFGNTDGKTCGKAQLVKSENGGGKKGKETVANEPKVEGRVGVKGVPISSKTERATEVERLIELVRKGLKWQTTTRLMWRKIEIVWRNNGWPRTMKSSMACVWNTKVRRLREKKARLSKAGEPIVLTKDEQAIEELLAKMRSLPKSADQASSAPDDASSSGSESECVDDAWLVREKSEDFLELMRAVSRRIRDLRDFETKDDGPARGRIFEEIKKSLPVTNKYRHVQTISLPIRSRLHTLKMKMERTKPSVWTFSEADLIVLRVNGIRLSADRKSILQDKHKRIVKAVEVNDEPTKNDETSEHAEKERSADEVEVDARIDELDGRPTSADPEQNVEVVEPSSVSKPESTVRVTERAVADPEESLTAVGGEVRCDSEENVDVVGGPPSLVSEGNEDTVEEASPTYVPEISENVVEMKYSIKGQNIEIVKKPTSPSPQKSADVVEAQVSCSPEEQRREVSQSTGGKWSIVVSEEARTSSLPESEDIFEGRCSSVCEESLNVVEGAAFSNPIEKMDVVAEASRSPMSPSCNPADDQAIVPTFSEEEPSDGLNDDEGMRISPSQMNSVVKALQRYMQTHEDVCGENFSTICSLDDLNFGVDLKSREVKDEMEKYLQMATLLQSLSIDFCVTVVELFLSKGRSIELDVHFPKKPRSSAEFAQSESSVASDVESPESIRRAKKAEKKAHIEFVEQLRCFKETQTVLTRQHSAYIDDLITRSEQRTEVLERALSSEGLERASSSTTTRKRKAAPVEQQLPISPFQLFLSSRAGKYADLPPEKRERKLWRKFKKLSDFDREIFENLAASL